MATTKFRVVNLNPDFEYPVGSGFWLTTYSDGGIDPDTNDDGVADDPSTIPPAGTYSDAEERGIYVWLSPSDTSVTKYEFDVDGDVANPRSKAGMLRSALEEMWFAWQPKNPEWNTVAPVLKDGVTPNPDFDNSGNPIKWQSTDHADRVGDLCKHFEVTTTVTAREAAKPKTKAKAKAKDAK
jgi:hypothetical protein